MGRCDADVSSERHIAAGCPLCAALVAHQEDRQPAGGDTAAARVRFMACPSASAHALPRQPAKVHLQIPATH